MLGAVAAFVQDLILGLVCGHYTQSSDIARRSLALGPRDVVIDVGGGTGGVSAELRADVERIIVVEPDGAALRRGRRRYPGVHFVQGDGAALPIVDASADAALLLEVLHHVPDARRVLAEVSRVLRGDGRILIEESEFEGALARRLRYFAEKVLTNGVWPRSRGMLSSQLSELGFAAEPLEHEGFVMVARRVDGAG
jgi:ubiquinone/menaquinone biosynthesis C-methylase UbiE